jgi:hypothetical protein
MFAGGPTKSSIASIVSPCKCDHAATDAAAASRGSARREGRAPPCTPSRASPQRLPAPWRPHFSQLVGDRPMERSAQRRTSAGRARDWRSGAPHRHGHCDPRTGSLGAIPGCRHPLRQRLEAANERLNNRRKCSFAPHPACRLIGAASPRQKRRAILHAFFA